MVLDAFRYGWIGNFQEKPIPLRVMNGWSWRRQFCILTRAHTACFCLARSKPQIINPGPDPKMGLGSLTSAVVPEPKP